MQRLDSCRSFCSAGLHVTHRWDTQLWDLMQRAVPCSHTAHDTEQCWPDAIALLLPSPLMEAALPECHIVATHCRCIPSWRMWKCEKSCPLQSLLKTLCSCVSGACIPKRRGERASSWPGARGTAYCRVVTTAQVLSQRLGPPVRLVTGDRPRSCGKEENLLMGGCRQRDDVSGTYCGHVCAICHVATKTLEENWQRVHWETRSRRRIALINTHRNFEAYTFTKRPDQPSTGSGSLAFYQTSIANL